jgi:thioredoxin-like negative regulator of GroEL
MQEAFHHSAYYAAAQPGSLSAVPLAAIAEVDEPMERVAKAKYIFHHGDLGEAQTVLDEAFAMKTSFPEAELLQAEIDFKGGDVRAARQAVDGLLSQPGTPLWIKEYIKRINNPADGNSAEKIDDLQSALEDNPVDPWLRLELVDALLAAGRYAEVEEELRQALESGGEDPEVYDRAGDILAAHNLWAYAAAAYVNSALLRGDPMVGKTDEKIAQAVFLGATNPNAPDIYVDIESHLDAVIAEVGRIRHTLHSDDVALAQRKLTPLKEAHPDSTEVALLEAEILYLAGQQDTALEQWNVLVEDESAPRWVRDQAKIFITRYDR